MILSLTERIQVRDCKVKALNRKPNNLKALPSARLLRSREIMRGISDRLLAMFVPAAGLPESPASSEVGPGAHKLPWGLIDAMARSEGVPPQPEFKRARGFSCSCEAQNTPPQNGGDRDLGYQLLASIWRRPCRSRASRPTSQSWGRGLGRPVD